MASASTSSMYECPVCTEEFSDPKLLPCAHIVCRKCIVSWIGKGGGQNTCPLCRAPVLSSTQSQSNIVALVDALPTDLVILAIVESHKVLQGPHVCTMCQNNVTATSYCFECEVKLCQPCTSYHRNLPASKKHNLEQLNKLTAKQLAANCRSTCKTHPDDSAKVYCPAHQEVVCMLCAATTHGNCADKKMIDEVAGEKRRELEQRAHRLREMETELSKQIKEVKDNSDALLSQAKVTFDDLQQCLEKRRQEVYKQIQTRKDASMTSLRELERLKTALASNAASVEDMMDSAPEGALLSMLKNMMSRLDDLESQGRTANKIKVDDFILDSQKLTQLKADIATLGRIETPVTTPTPKPTPVTTPSPKPTPVATTTPLMPATTPKPRRAELARVLKVGDRVTRGPDWFLWRNDDEGGPGTVTAIPSRIRAARGRDPQGWVDVRWDCGGEGWYRMGRNGRYHLD